MKFQTTRSIAISIIVVGMLLGAGQLHAGGKDPGNYFGSVHELEGARVDELRQLLIAIGEDCATVDKKCDASTELFELVSDRLNMGGFPTLLVYIDEDSRIRTNVLIDRKKVTPFLYGQRNVWVAVFSEHSLDLEARLTTLWRQRKSSLSNLDGVFITEGKKTIEGREAQEETGKMVFDRLSGEDASDDLYYSTGRFFIEPLGVYSITVVPVDGPQKSEPDFVELRANFSNSMDASVGFGLALGATLRTEETDDLILDGVSVGDANLNLYLALDIYIIKPTVLAPMTQSIWGRYRPSIGIALMTNIEFWEAKEFIVGVSFGHLFGKHGLVVGANIIDAPSEIDDDRIIRPYIAGVFKF